MKRVSFKAIARACGCSVTTVFRALHGTGRVSDATREKVLACAERLGLGQEESEPDEGHGGILVFFEVKRSLGSMGRLIRLRSRAAKCHQYGKKNN